MPNHRQKENAQNVNKLKIAVGCVFLTFHFLQQTVNLLILPSLHGTDEKFSFATTLVRAPLVLVDCWWSNLGWPDLFWLRNESGFGFRWLKFFSLWKCQFWLRFLGSDSYFGAVLESGSRSEPLRSSWSLELEGRYILTDSDYREGEITGHVES